MAKSADKVMLVEENDESEREVQFDENVAQIHAHAIPERVLEPFCYSIDAA